MTAVTGTKKKFNVLGHNTISVERLHPNPKNPRPSFHFGADNPEIKALGDSISVDGLHNPLKVYELMPEAPGNFRIVQGHRRYEAARLVGVEALDCIIIERPQSEKEELEWLGSEDAHKRAWSESGLFQMKHAYELAKELGSKVAHPDIVSRTGLTMKQLEVAEKLFNLEPEIQALVVAYEKAKYELALQAAGPGQHQQHRRMYGSGVKVTEFPPERAAACWDLFEALRAQCTLMVKEWGDFDLQLKIAQWSTQRGGMDGLRALTAAVKASGQSPRPGLQTQISDLLVNENRRVADVVKTTKNGYIVKLSKAAKAIKSLDTTIQGLSNNFDQLGGNVELLKEVERHVLALQLHATTFQAKLERLIRDEERGK